MQVVPFKLAGITTDEFASFRDRYDATDEAFDIGFSVQLGAIKRNRQVSVSTRLTFSQTDGEVLVLTCTCYFLIEESYWAEVSEGDYITVEPELATHFLILTVGTARGIIHTKKPSWVIDLMLPTIDVSRVITEAARVSIRDEEE